MPKEFHNEILKNKEQLKEWVELGFGKIGNEKKLTGKKLPFDTKYFDNNFKDRLLEKLSEQGNLDDLIDGILIKSENWQAINLLLKKYRGEVKCIYIDPPYNTGSEEFIYKDKYQHSCWLSMVTDRLELSRELLNLSGTIGISIDNNEIEHLLKLMDLLFENRRAIVTVKRGSVTGPKVINPGVVNVAEFLVIYSKEVANWKPNRVYKVRERDRRYSKFIINREQDPSKWVFVPLLQAFGEFKGIRKLSLKKTLGDDYEKELGQFILAHANAVARTAALDADKISKEAIELKKRSLKSPNTIYHFKREEHEDWYIMGGERILFYSDRLVRIGSELVQGELLTDIWDDTLPNDLHNEGGVTLKKGKKPEKLVGRFLELATESGDLVLDFFCR